MADVNAKDMTFNGIKLSDKSGSYMLVSFNNDSNSDIMERNISRSDITNDMVITNDYGAVDSSVLKFEVTICKDTGDSFTKSEIKDIIGWLTSPTKPTQLSFTGYDDGNGNEIYNDVFFFGRFVKASYQEMGGVYKHAIIANFENNSPYGYTKEYEYTINSYSDSNGVLNIPNLGTATGKIIVPKITITVLDSGEITINNTSDVYTPAFSFNGVKDEVITMSNLNIFNADGTLFDLKKCNNLYIPIMRDGDNLFSVSGHCNVVVTTRFYENIGI